MKPYRVAVRITCDSRRLSSTRHVPSMHRAQAAAFTDLFLTFLLHGK